MNDADPAPRGDVVETRGTSEPAPFMPNGVDWYHQLDGYVELVFAAQIAHYGLAGLYAQPRHCLALFPWYADTYQGWENRGRDYGKLLPFEDGSAPPGPSKEIISVVDLAAFCKYAISNLVAKIVSFESQAYDDPIHPGLLLSGVAEFPLGRYKPYDASRLIQDVYRVCTCLLPANRVPPRPGGRSGRRLAAFLDRVHIACLNTRTRGRPERHLPAQSGRRIAAKVNTESEHGKKKSQRIRLMRPWDLACLAAFENRRKTDRKVKLKTFIRDWISQHQRDFREEKPGGLSLKSMYATLRQRVKKTRSKK